MQTRRQAALRLIFVTCNVRCRWSFISFRHTESLADMRLKTGFTYLFIAVVALTGCRRSFHWSKEQRQQPYRVLVMQSSAAPGLMPTVQYLIERELKKSGLPLNIFYVYHQTMDTPVEESWRAFDEKMKPFNENPPDIIIAVNDDALNFLLASGIPMTLEVPIVFTNVTFPLQPLLDEHPNVTGLLEKVDYRQAYELAKQLFGEIDEIQLLYGFQRLDSHHYDYAVKAFAGFPELSTGRCIKERFSGGPYYMPVDTIRPPETLAHPLVVNHDIITVWPFDQFSRYYDREKPRFPVRRIGIKAGEESIYSRFFSYYYLPCINVNNSYFPSVQMESFPIQSGCIGGYMNPIENQTAQAVSTAVRILKGEPVSHFPVDTAARIPIFDWNALQHWHIAEDRLPEGSRIVNKPFVREYRNGLITAAASGLLLTGLLIYLLVRYSRQTRFAGNALFKKLKQEQEHMQITVNSVNEGILSFDKNGLVISANPTVESLLGQAANPEPLVGQPVHNILQLSSVHGNDRFWLSDLSEKAYNTGKKQVLPEGTLLHLRNGKTLRIVGIVRSLFLNGQSIGTLFTFRDCTDKLRQSRFMEFSMAAGDVYTWQIDGEKGYITFHESFFVQHPIEHTETGLPYGQFTELIHPDDKPGWKAVLEKMERNAQGDKQRVELRLATPAGYVWFEFRVSRMPATGLGRTSGLFGICLSIQQLKETEASMLQILEEAKENNRIKSEFLANMSHEIRTPLNAIVGFSSIINEVPPEERAQFMELIGSNCDMLLQTINDILDISRIESGFPFQYKVCSLHGLFTVWWKELQELFADGKVQLFLHLPDEEMLVETDPFRLKQVLVQLVKNARQFTPSGSVTFGYKPAAGEGCVELYVRDTGIGIRPEHREIVFERFYKLNSFTAGGGLGLSLCKEIVSRLHGNIRIAGVPDGGTCVMVELPVHPVVPEN